MKKEKKSIDIKEGFRSSYSGIFGCSPQENSYEKSPIIILPVPYEQTVSYKGNTKEGPRSIIEASRYLETYDEELDYEVYQLGIHTLPEIETECAGPEVMYHRLKEISTRIAKDGKFLVTLGGEHSITPGLVAGVMTSYPGLTVIQIDAHADLREDFEGTPYSHACAMRRCRDLGLKTFGFGIRSLSVEEAHYVKKTGRAFYTAKELKENFSVVEEIVDSIRGPVYLTMDIDGMDPAYIPATGTPEPGGLDWYEMRNIISILARRKKIVAMDLVELAPIPGLVAPDFLCAKLIYKILGLVFYKQDRK